MEIRQDKKKLIYIVLTILPITLFFLFIFGFFSSSDANAVSTQAPAGAASFVSGVTTATEAGTPTTTCKLGANSAANIGDLIKVDAGNNTFNRGLNFGWVLTVLKDINEINGYEGITKIKKLIQDFRKSGTSVIIRICNGAECNGLGPQGASDITMANDGKQLGKYLTLLSYELMKDDQGGGAKTSPFWVIAGHNEPNAAEWRTPSGETAFMNSLINEVSDSYEVNKNLLELGITDPGLSASGAMPKEAFFFGIRSRINLLSPEVQNVPDGAESSTALKYYDAPSNAGGGGGAGCNGAKGGYFSRMIKCGAIFGELDGIATNLYTVADIKQGLEYAQTRQKKLYVLESGPENVFSKGGDAVRNSSNSFDSVVAYTDAEAKQYRYTFVDQFINNPQIGAILPFNSLPLSDLTAMTGNPVADRDFQPYTKNMYARKDANDAENFTKLAGTDNRYKTVTVSSKDASGNVTEKKIKTEPVSMNLGWPVFYEAQVIDMLNSAGCSNVFTRQCNYQADGSDNNKVATVNADSSDTKTAYYDMVDSIKNTDKESALAFKPWTKTVCIKYTYNGLGVVCDKKDIRNITITNMLTDAVFKSDMLTTVQVNIPLANTLSNTSINGTDELNYTQYGGSLKRMSYQDNVDFSRKSDATLQIDLPGNGGAKTQIAFPQLGSAIDLYSRDFFDYSTTDPDVLNQPKDFLNVTYKVPNSSVKADMSPAGRRLELENSKTSIKSIGELATPYANASGKSSSDSKLIRANGTDDTGMTKYTVYSSSVNDQVGQGGAIPDYKNYQAIKTDAKTDKVQFNASEILSEEAAVSRAQLEQNYFVSCSNITEYDKNLIGAGGKPMTFKNNEYPIAVNYDQDYSHGRCDGYPEGGVPGVNFTVTDGSGATVTDYSGMDSNLIPPGKPGSAYKDNHLTTVSKDCYRAWCQLASNKRKVDTDPEFNGGGGTNASAYSSGGSQFAFAYFPLTKDYSFLSKIQTASANVDSGSGMMRILRTAWEQSNRLQYKLNSTTTTGNSVGGTTPISNALRICHKDISVQAKVYTRNYTVASHQEEYYTGNLDQCYNPNNHVQWSYKRSALKPEADKTYTISTSEFPWIGTVAAINERLSKADYFYLNNTATGATTNVNLNGTTLSTANLDALALKSCGSGDNSDPTMCYCDAEQKDPLAIYLCQNGWLTDKEKTEAGLTAEDCKKPDTSNVSSVNGTFLHGSGDKICSAYNDPKIQSIFSAAEKSSGVPKEILASIWNTESGCGLPTGSDILNGKVQDQNNLICARCNLEGAGKDPNSVTLADQQDSGLANYNACKAASTGKSCNDAAVKYNYPGVVQCCDARGPTQFEIGTWNGSIVNDPKFISCRKALGTLGLKTSNAPDRAVFGDALCGSMTKFSNASGGTTTWDDATIFKIAQNYHGGGGCLAYPDYSAKLASGGLSSMTIGESYCGRVVDLVNSIRTAK
ncbi:MAG: hypothetical protein WCO33_01170 [bacterium]